MGELKETIEDLKSQLERMATAQKMPPEYAVMFTRLDAERNARALQRAASSKRINRQQIEDAIEAMEEYVDLPVQRLMHMMLNPQKQQRQHQQQQLRSGKHEASGVGNKDRDETELQQQQQQLKTEKTTLSQARTEGGVTTVTDAYTDLGPMLSADIEKLAMERMKLAENIMMKLQQIEQDAGIFLIKPYFSFPGRNIHDRERFKFKTSRPIQEFEPTFKTPLKSQPTFISSYSGADSTPTTANNPNRVQLKPIAGTGGTQSPPTIDGSKAPNGNFVPPPEGRWNVSS